MRTVGHPDDAAIEAAFARLYDDNDAPYTFTPKRRNVVLFFLESWSGVNLAPYGAAEETTPFYDSILPRSLRPVAAIAGGHRTTEGMFAALVSFQNPLGRSVAKTRLQSFGYDTLIDLFNARGYRSAFFQGTARETSGTGAFAQALGFTESYGKEDVTRRRYGTNSWGVYDQDLYAFVLDTLEGSEKPFIIGINGATTHDNKLPEGVAMRRFSDDPRENGILNALRFADAALGEFVRAVEAKWPDTLFVFFADHCGGVASGTFGNYMIPLAFYGRGIPARRVDAIVSQRDIAPTVVDLVLGDYKQLAPDFSGKSLVTDTHFFADYYHNGTLGWVEGKHAVEYIPDADRTECYELASLRPRPVPCPPELTDLTARAVAFTALSQQLLFEGKTTQFHKWRYRSR
jgi:phosphoglycerol transferase MdoB-like AlkP superfamily enzyme